MVPNGNKGKQLKSIYIGSYISWFFEEVIYKDIEKIYTMYVMFWINYMCMRRIILSIFFEYGL